MTRRKRKVPVAAHTDSEQGAYSSPPCYLHEFEAQAAPTQAGARIKRIHGKPEAAGHRTRRTKSP
jgi:hypothetical protein